MTFAALSRSHAIRRSAVALRSAPRLPTTKYASQTTPAAPPRRFMAGGGGHAPISRSMEAEPFQGHPKEPEGWETTIYITYAASAVLLTFALGFAPDTSIKTVRASVPSPAAG